MRFGNLNHFHIQNAYFNPRTPLQSAITSVWLETGRRNHFNPRTPLQSAIPGGHRIKASKGISIHALHYRVRCGQNAFNRPTFDNFNPRTPLQSAIRATGRWQGSGRHFNPRTPLQSAISRIIKNKVALISISIHALHYRVRFVDSVWAIPRKDISIHALHYRVRFFELRSAQRLQPISIHALHYRVR